MIKSNLNPSENMTVTQVAEFFGVTRGTLWRWYKSGNFPDARKSGPGKTSTIHIPVDNVKSLADQLGIEYIPIDTAPA